MPSKALDFKESLRKVAKEVLAGLSGSSTLRVDSQEDIISKLMEGAAKFRVQ
jgi:hypothetical protein